MNSEMIYMNAIALNILIALAIIFAIGTVIMVFAIMNVSGKCSEEEERIELEYLKKMQEEKHED